MPITKLIDSLNGTCRHCGQKTGILQRNHPQCRQTHQSGMNEMTQLAAQAAGTSSFNETALRSTLQAIATRARAAEEDISQAIADGWAQGVNHAMQDGTLTADEETNLRTFRDRMADHDLPSVITGPTTLDRASTDRITSLARSAAIGQGGGGTLQELDNALRRTSMSNTHRRQLLIRAWEEAVEGAIRDGLVSLDEENALAQYADHFGLTQEELNRNGAQTTLVQARVIRDVTQGIIPQRQTIMGAIPFNLMKSETLVWVIDGVDYLENLQLLCPSCNRIKGTGPTSTWWRDWRKWRGEKWHQWTIGKGTRKTKLRYALAVGRQSKRSSVPQITTDPTFAVLNAHIAGLLILGLRFNV